MFRDVNINVILNDCDLIRFVSVSGTGWAAGRQTASTLVKSQAASAGEFPAALLAAAFAGEFSTK